MNAEKRLGQLACLVLGVTESGYHSRSPSAPVTAAGLTHRQIQVIDRASVGTYKHPAGVAPSCTSGGTLQSTHGYRSMTSPPSAQDPPKKSVIREMGGTRFLGPIVQLRPCCALRDDVTSCCKHTVRDGHGQQ